ncbi:MAG: ATP-binding protein [Caldilineaceae bacterium]
MNNDFPLSNARAYFEYIQSQRDPFGFLKEIPFLPEPSFEEEWLDYKGQPQDDKGARKIWSKALSGYANTTDGLIIWGVDARKTKPRDIDAASGLRLITDPQSFESRLRDWVRDATNPPVMGIEYASFVGPENSGFVVCLIPESSYKPHRAEFADKRYYYRAGDDFLIVEPSLLRVLFYPQSSARFKLEATLRYDLKPPDLAAAFRESPNHLSYTRLVNGKSTLSLNVRMQNVGTATAKDVYVSVHFRENIRPPYPGPDWMSSSNPQADFAFSAMRPFHPGEMVDIFNASFAKQFPNMAREGLQENEIVPHFGNIGLRLVIYAEGSQPQEAIFEFVPADFDYNTSSITKVMSVIYS